MSRLGIVAVDDVVTTARYFERAAREDGHAVAVHTGSAAPLDADLAQLLVMDPFVMSPGRLRTAPCPVLGYVIDAHQQLGPRLAYSKYFDHVFVAQPEYIEQFQALPHPSVHWLPLGCDPHVHFVPGLARSIDVGFVGKLGQPGSERHATLSRVLSAFATNDWSRPYTPAEMGEVYSRSKIVFNKSINRDLNMRFFEGLAAGALLVTDRIGNGMERIGRAGEHYVVYDTADDAIAKIGYYLEHDDERAAIARAGQQLVFGDHTYAHRLRQMLDVAARNESARAPARTALPAIEARWRSELMRMNGTVPVNGLSLLGEGHLLPSIWANVAVGMLRGTVRPMRQRLQRSAASYKARGRKWL